MLNKAVRELSLICVFFFFFSLTIMNFNLNPVFYPELCFSGITLGILLKNERKITSLMKKVSVDSLLYDKLSNENFSFKIIFSSMCLFYSQ